MSTDVLTCLSARHLPAQLRGAVQIWPAEQEGQRQPPEPAGAQNAQGSPLRGSRTPSNPARAEPARTRSPQPDRPATLGRPAPLHKYENLHGWLDTEIMGAYVEA